MRTRQELRQPNISQESCPEKAAVNPPGSSGVPSDCPEQTAKDIGKAPSKLMEQVLERSRMQAALKKVKSNKGAPGIDGMTVEELPAYLKENWPAIREQLLLGIYKPQPVRRVEIPKPGGGMRMLGIPTVLDRLIQQVIQDALTPIFDPEFSEASYGFRPGRSAHQAIAKAQKHIRAGYTHVVDMDLEKFFDRVNHDILMRRIARRIQDRRVLALIRAYLNTGIMVDGVCVRSEEGTPQGGPLSPLLANILLDDLDKELGSRGHRFVRYADDCNVYVRSRRAGARVMESVEKYLEERLKLKVNRDKSAVDRPWKRKFLGFSFTRDKRIRIAPRTLERFKEKVRDLTSRTWSIDMRKRVERLNQYLRGWLGYFQLAEIKKLVQQLDEWLRRRLRMCLLKQWKRPKTKRRKLVGLGIPNEWASLISRSRKGYWRLANSPQMNKALGLTYWQGQGLLSLAEMQRKLCFAT